MDEATGKSPRQALGTKRILFTRIRIYRMSRITSARRKGRFAIVTGRGPGGGGRDGVGREMRCRAGSPREQKASRDDTALTASSKGLDGERTRAAEGPARTCADGQVVWSWRPKLASSLWRRLMPTGVSCQEIHGRRGQ